MAPHGFRLALGAALLTGTVIVACGGDDDDPGGFDDPDAAVDSGNPREAGPDDPDATEDSSDSGQKDAKSDARDTADEDSGPKDAGLDVMGLPPGTIIDLTGAAESHVSAKLTWTSPPGNTPGYEIRYAATPITTEAEYLAATVATPAEPVAVLPTGSRQTAIVIGLTPETTYHFVVRVKEPGAAGDAGGDADADVGADAGASGPLSNDAMVTTSGRARLLISEIAPANTTAEGDDFVELVATKAGSVAGLMVSMGYQQVLHTFAPLDVAVGDRIVIHASGLDPAPTNFAQEDETKDKTSSTASNASAGAYDVYSAVKDMPAYVGAITIRDGAGFQDLVPYAYGDPAIDGPNYTLARVEWTFAWQQNEWAFSKHPFNQLNAICLFTPEVVNSSGDTPPQCGLYPGFLLPGSSIQRNGMVDTNWKDDFVVAPQTRGTENAPYCAADTAKLVIREVNPRANLVELSVLQGGRLRAFDLRTNPQDQTGPGAGTNLLTLPDVCAATGDTIVVHLGTDATPNETTAKDQHEKATYASYYDNAWDFVTPNTLTFASSVVVALRNPANVFVDVVAFSDQTTATTGDYVASLRYVQGKGLWLPADCGGADCGNSTEPTAREVAASWAGLDTTSGTSVERTGNDVPSQASAWSVGTASFGQ